MQNFDKKSRFEILRPKILKFEILNPKTENLKIVKISKNQKFDKKIKILTKKLHFELPTAMNKLVWLKTVAIIRLI